VTLATLWTPVLPPLLAGLGQPEVRFVFDPTPYRADATILCPTVVWWGRVRPVAWRVGPQQTDWPERLAPLLAALLAAASAAWPSGCTPTLRGDRGLVGPAVIDAARDAGWHVVLRLQASAGEATRVRWPDGRKQRLAEVPIGPGQRVAVPAAICKGAGWRQGSLTIHWARGEDEPWVLFSDRPGGPARVRE
jgi:hypothetical protein